MMIASITSFITEVIVGQEFESRQHYPGLMGFNLISSKCCVHIFIVVVKFHETIQICLFSISILIFELSEH